MIHMRRNVSKKLHDGLKGRTVMDAEPHNWRKMNWKAAKVR